MWHLLALVNWQDQAQEMQIDLSRIWFRSPYFVPASANSRGQAGVIANGQRVGQPAVSRNGALRLAPAEPWSPPIPGQRPARFPGSRDKHLGGISARSPSQPAGDRVASGKIWLSLPRLPQRVTCNGAPAQFELSRTDCCITLDTAQTAVIRLGWGP